MVIAGRSCALYEPDLGVDRALPTAAKAAYAVAVCAVNGEEYAAESTGGNAPRALARQLVAAASRTSPVVIVTEIDVAEATDPPD
jgi:hypothetical protein